MCEIRYEDLPIIFQSDGAVEDEIDSKVWDFLVICKETGMLQELSYWQIQTACLLIPKTPINISFGGVV